MADKGESSGLSRVDSAGVESRRGESGPLRPARGAEDGVDMGTTPVGGEVEGRELREGTVKIFLASPMAYLAFIMQSSADIGNRRLMLSCRITSGAKCRSRSRSGSAVRSAGSLKEATGCSIRLFMKFNTSDSVTSTPFPTFRRAANR